jgi:hypothetical protein
MISDFTNSYVTSNFEHTKLDDFNAVFHKKTSLLMTLMENEPKQPYRKQAHNQTVLFEH